jgi:hypothetical protein
MQAPAEAASPNTATTAETLLFILVVRSLARSIACVHAPVTFMGLPPEAATGLNGLLLARCAPLRTRSLTPRDGNGTRALRGFALLIGSLWPSRRLRNAMRLFGSQLNAFACGMAAGWLVAYLSLTHERRTVKGVRKAVVELADYHDLNSAQSRLLRHRDLATDDEVREVYRWVRKIPLNDTNRPWFVSREVWRWVRTLVIGLPIAQHPRIMAAEVLLCTKVLGLTEFHATRALVRSKTLSDVKQALAAVTAQIEEEHRQRDERDAAEQAVRAERQAKADAAWEAERNGDPDWFEKLTDGLKPRE